MPPKEDPQKVEVTLEDQQRINEFNRLNGKSHELKAMMEAKKKLLEDLEDASNELMLSDEENIRYVIGGCFVSLEKDEAETTLQGQVDKENQSVKDLKAQLAETVEKMNKLKAVLYGKFGNSINLEE